MLVTVFFCFFLHFVRSTPLITVYGDVYKDREFFSKTFPWIIDNIGGELVVDYYLLGSGRYSVPQMCTLKNLRQNTFLQAQYLKCEADGNSSKYCICETGIDPHWFKDCVNEGGSLAAVASSNFKMLNIGTTPLVEVGPKSTIFEVGASWYLKKICTIFGDNPPLGCINPFSCCNNGTDTYVPKTAIAQFDRECTGGPGPDPQPEAPTTTTTSMTTPEYPKIEYPVLY